MAAGRAGRAPHCKVTRVLPHIVLGRDASEPSAQSREMKGRPPLMCSPRHSAVVCVTNPSTSPAPSTAVNYLGELLQYLRSPRQSRTLQGTDSASAPHSESFSMKQDAARAIRREDLRQKASQYPHEEEERQS